MNNPSLLLFDLGGVLIENVGFERLNRILPESVDSTALKDQWLQSSSVRRFELGECSPTDFAVEFIAEWHIDTDPEIFLSEFSSWPKGFYPQAQNLIRTLRQKYSVGCLSNSNALHWKRFDGFKDDFDFALSSHLLGVIKPDREAFVAALTKCGKEPREVYFYDDSISNVKAAESVGMRAFHVDGFQALEEALRHEHML